MFWENDFHYATVCLPFFSLNLKPMTLSLRLKFTFHWNVLLGFNENLGWFFRSWLRFPCNKTSFCFTPKRHLFSRTLGFPNLVLGSLSFRGEMGGTFHSSVQGNSSKRVLCVFGWLRMTKFLAPKWGLQETLGGIFHEKNSQEGFFTCTYTWTWLNPAHPGPGSAHIDKICGVSSLWFKDKSPARLGVLRQFSQNSCLVCDQSSQFKDMLNTLETLSF